MNPRSGSQIIGYLKNANQPIEVTDADGNARTINLGDPVYFEDIIENGTDAAVVIELINGQLINLAIQQQIIMGPEILTNTESGSDGQQEDKEILPEQEVATPDNEERSEPSEVSEPEVAGGIDEQFVIERVTSSQTEANTDSSSEPDSATSENDAPPPVETSTVTLNQKPEIQNQSFQVNENVLSDGSVVVGTVSASDGGSSQGLTFSIISGNDDGKFAINPTTGEITVAGELNHEAIADYSLTVGVTDSGNLTENATIIITVNDLNEAPEAQGDIVSGHENETLTLNVLTNDTDEDETDTPANFSLDTAEIIDINGVPVTGQGSVSINGNQLQFTPGNDFNYLPAGSSETVLIRYQMSDDQGASAESTVNVTVTGVNDAPETSNNMLTLDEDSAHTFSLSEFAFSDLDTGDTLESIKVISLPSAGGLSLNGTAISAPQVINAADIHNLVFTPEANDNGIAYASFLFSVNDGYEESAPQTITFNVNAINDAPTAGDSTLTILEDGTHTFAAEEFGFSDVDTGDTLQSVTITQLPADGSLTLNGSAVTLNQTISVANIGNLAFSPAANANSDAYTTVGFTVSDGQLSSAAQTITFNVMPVNDAPVLALDTDTINYNWSWNANQDWGNNGQQWNDGGNNAFDGFGMTSLTINGQTSYNMVLGLPGQAAMTHTIGGETITSEVRFISQNILSIKLDGPEDLEAGLLRVGGNLGSDGTETLFTDTMTLNGKTVTYAQSVNISNASSIDQIGSDPNIFFAIIPESNVSQPQPSYTRPSGYMWGDLSNFNFPVQVLIIPHRESVSDIVSLLQNQLYADHQMTDITEADNNGNTVAELLNESQISDIDGSVTEAIAMTGHSGNGTWQYSLDNGGSWQNVDDGSLSESHALLLAAEHRVRFVPGQTNGTADFTFRAWDQSTGSAGNYADTTTNGDETAFSANSAAAHITFDLNDAPTSSDATLTINEDSSHTFSINDFAFSDLDNADSLHSITITQLPSAGSLTLNGAAVTVNQVIPAGDIGLLRFAPDANGNGTAYAGVGFTVSDGELSSAAHTLTFNVNAINDAPVASDNTLTINEDQSHTFAASDFGFSDVDTGDTLRLVTITQLPTNGSLTLNGSAVSLNQTISVDNIENLAFTPAANANGDAYSNVGFTVSDGQLNSADQVITFNVIPVNDAPVIADQSFAVNENVLTNGSVLVGTVAASDVDDGQTRSYAITAGNDDGKFAINSTTGDITVVGALDHEILDSYSLTVEVTDNGNPSLSSSATITIGVNDLNEAPVVTDQSFAVNENVLANGTVIVGTVSSSDVDDGQTRSYAITGGNDEGKFTINSTTGDITVVGALDHETLDSYSLTVQVTDNGNPALSDTATVTIGVNDQNDAPTASDNTLTINEDQSHTFAASDFGFSDVDTGDTLRLVTITQLPTNGSLTLNGSAVSLNQTISVDNIENLAFTPAANANGDAYSNVGFTVSDGQLNSADQVITFNVIPVNDAPVIADQSFAVNENVLANGTVIVGTVSSSDVDDGQTRSYAITAGNDDGKFAINSTTGDITVVGALDHETLDSYSLTVEVTDNGNPSLSSSATITIGVNDLNEAPVVTDQSFAVNENVLANGTVIVGTVSSSDVDDGQTRSYAITGGNDEGKFTINSTTGDITVVGALDHETLDSYSLTVQVTDNGNPALSDTATVTIGVNDQNDAPEATSNTLSLDENSSRAFTAADFGFTDEDAGDTLHSITVTTLPGAGSLTLNGSAVFANQVISAANLGNLVFTPAANTNGASYTSFNFTVNDGAANSTAKTMTFDVYLIVNQILTFDSGSSIDGVTFSSDLRFNDIGGGHRFLQSFTTNDSIYFSQPTHVMGFDMNAMPWEGYDSANHPTHEVTVLAFNGASEIWRSTVDLTNYQNWNNWLHVNVNVQNVTELRFLAPGSAMWPSIDNLSISTPTLPPVVIDLDGDGLELISLPESTVSMDVDNDGNKERISWVDADDGFIITDLDGDGNLSSQEELFIAQQTAENDTDLEALATLYDTNKDGVLNSDDEKFDDILIFQDKNQDGSSDAGEIFSLDELGINEISVVSDNRQQVLSDGSVIHGQATYSKIDGTEGVIGDVGLAYSENSSQAGKSSAVEDSNTYENEPIVEINQSASDNLETLIGDQNNELIFLGNHEVSTNSNIFNEFHIDNDPESPSEIIINDFNINDEGSINFQDILEEENESLEQYFHFVSSGNDTIMEISHEQNGDIYKQVTFKGVDLFTLGSNDSDILNKLIDNDSFSFD